MLDPNDELPTPFFSQTMHQHGVRSHDLRDRHTAGTKPATTDQPTHQAIRYWRIATSCDANGRSVKRHGPKTGAVLRPRSGPQKVKPDSGLGPKTRPRQVRSETDLSYGASLFLGATVFRPAVERSSRMLPFPNS